MESAGFAKKGGAANRIYSLEIFFNNAAILKGIQNDDWDEAFVQLKDIWEVISKIDYEFLIKPMKEHRKKNNFSTVY